MDDSLPEEKRQVQIDAQVHVERIEGGEVSAVRIGHIAGSVTLGYSAEKVSRLVEQIRTGFTPRPFSGECPYLGLETFQESDAGRFFGRERLVAQVLEKAAAARFIALAGPSGSGKSSLVRAGLLPVLKGIHPRQPTPIPGSPNWLYTTLRPGRQPLEALGRAISALTRSLQALEDFRSKGLDGGGLLADWLELTLGDDPKRRVVLFVDQFEETFTQLPPESEPIRAAFLDLLVQAASRPNGRTILVLTLRSDFIANCAAYPALNTLLNSGFLQVGAMSAEELATAIARPALEAGLPIEDELVRRVMNEMRDQPGGLPLMQFALRDLFTARQEKGGAIRLGLDDYLERGGLGQALERYANQAFYQLSRSEQGLARWVFSGLVQPGRGTQDTARRARFEELAPAGVPLTEIEGLIRKLADARLVTTEEREGEQGSVRSVALAHERLLEAWSWLDRLVDENRQAITLSNQIADDAQRWDDNQRDPSYLYAGARLLAAEEAIDEGKLALSERGKDYIRASAQRREAEQREARRRNQLLVVGLAAAAVVFAIFALTAMVFRGQAEAQAATAVHFQSAAETEAAISAQQRAAALTAQAEAQQQRVAAEASAREADANARLALSRQLAARSAVEIETSEDRGLLLAAASGLFTDTVEARAAMLNGMRHLPKLRRILNTGTNSLSDIVFSPGGSLLLAVSCLDTSVSPCKLYSINFWDTNTGAQTGVPLLLEASELPAWSYDHKSHALVAGLCQPGCESSQVQVYSLRDELVDGQRYQMNAQIAAAHSGRLHTLAISPDGTHFATSDCDPQSDFYSQPRMINEVCTPQVFTVWETASGKMVKSISPFQIAQEISQTQIAETDTITNMTFTPDGERLVIASTSGAWIAVVDLLSGRIAWLAGLAPHTVGIKNPLISPDGATLAVYGCLQPPPPIAESCAGFAAFFDLASGEQLASKDMYRMNGASAAAFRADGSLRLAGGCLESSSSATPCLRSDAVVWDEAGGSVWGGRDLATNDLIKDFAMSADGRLLATSRFNQQVLVWDLDAQWIAGRELQDHRDYVQALVFSPDGGRLASGDSQGQLLLWELVQEGLWQPAYRLQAGSVVEFTPGGSTVISYDRLHPVIASQPDLPASQRAMPGSVSTLAFSPNSQQLAAGGSAPGDSPQGFVRLWDLRSRQLIQLQSQDKIGRVNALAFSADGLHLAALVGGGRAIVWTVEGGSVLFEGETFSPAWHLAISANGDRLAAANNTNIMLLSTAKADGSPPPNTNTPWGISHLVFDPNQSDLVIFGKNGETAFWDGGGQQPPQEQPGNGFALRRELLGWNGALETDASSALYLSLSDTRSQQLIPAEIWPTGQNYVYGAAVDPSGDWAAVGMGDGWLAFWSLRLQDWMADACRIANRELSEEEWRTYVGAEVPYQPVCGFGASH